MPLPSFRDSRRVAMLLSLGVSFLMLAGKLTAYAVTGSAAIFSDAAESVVHLLATAFVAYSLWYAIQPADERHPYGHGKIAYISSGFEGGLIMLASLTILFSAVRSIVVGPELRHLGTGMLLIGGAAAVNVALGRYLIWTGRRHHSLVLVSNGRHVLSDVWTSAGVLVGVGLVMLTGVAWLDPVVAIVFGLYIGYTGLDMLRHAAGGLLEAAESEDTARLVGELDAAVRSGTIRGYHQLRHRRVEDRLWVEYHLHFDASISLIEAHARSHEVEDAIGRLFPDNQVLITAHLEPEEHRRAHPAGHAEPEDPLAPTPIVAEGRGSTGA